MDTNLLSKQISYQANLKYFDTRLLNRLDDNVDRIYNDLKNKYNEGVEALNKYDFSNVNPEDNEYKIMLNNLHISDDLEALIETKIIYLWKLFEIRLISLIRFAYKVDTKDLFRFENIERTFKQYNISINKIKGYKIITELKDINNKCKHAGLKTNDKISHIEEFSEELYIPFIQAEIFYNRIKDIPEEYLEKLLNEIIEERLTFDDNKFKEIAEPLVERMEHPEALRFIQILVEIYGFNSKQIDKLP